MRKEGRGGSVIPHFLQKYRETRQMDGERYFRSTQALGSLFPSTHSSPAEPERRDRSHTYGRGGRDEQQHPRFPTGMDGKRSGPAPKGWSRALPPAQPLTPASAGEGR